MKGFAKSGRWILLRAGSASDPAPAPAPFPLCPSSCPWSLVLGKQQQPLIYMEGCDREMSLLKRYFAILMNFLAACQQIKNPALQEASDCHGWVSGARLWGLCSFPQEGHAHRQLPHISPHCQRILFDLASPGFLLSGFFLEETLPLPSDGHVLLVSISSEQQHLCRWFSGVFRNHLSPQQLLLQLVSSSHFVFATSLC